MVRLKRYIRTKIDRKLAISLQRGPFDPKVQVEVVVPNQPIILLFRKLNDLWHGIKIVTDAVMEFSRGADDTGIVRNHLHR